VETGESRPWLPVFLTHRLIVVVYIFSRRSGASIQTIPSVALEGDTTAVSLLVGTVCSIVHLRCRFGPNGDLRDHFYYNVTGFK
jgi:hypothetical protein